MAALRAPRDEQAVHGLAPHLDTMQLEATGLAEAIAADRSDALAGCAFGIRGVS
jgi:hypothetical protein